LNSKNINMAREFPLLPEEGWIPRSGRRGGGRAVRQNKNPIAGVFVLKLNF